MQISCTVGNFVPVLELWEVRKVVVVGGGEVWEGVHVFSRAIHSPAAAAGTAGEEFRECRFWAEMKELNINC